MESEVTESARNTGESSSSRHFIPTEFSQSVVFGKENLDIT